MKRRGDNTLSHRRLLMALAIQVLKANKQFATGAAIAHVIADYTDGNYPQINGSVYGIMRGMWDRGWALPWVEVDRFGAEFKTWDLTPAGRQALKRTLDEFDALRAAAEGKAIVRMAKAA